MKRKHTGNIIMFVIMTVFMLIFVGTMAYQTWAFVDWLMPKDALVMKLLTLLTFDIAATIWTAVDVFYPYATRGSMYAARSAMVIDYGLAVITTAFYFTLAYIFRFHIGFADVLVIAMYVIAIFSTVLNAILTIVFWSIEWGAYHPKEYLFDELEASASPVRVSMAQTATVPVLPPAKGQGLLGQIKNIVLGPDESPAPVNQPVARTRPRRQLTAKDRAMKYRGRAADPTPAPGKQQRSKAKKKLPAMKK